MAGSVNPIDKGGDGEPGAPFTIMGGWFCPSDTLAPGETCELRFFAIPHATGTSRGVIVLDTDDPTSPYSFSFVVEGDA